MAWLPGYAKRRKITVQQAYLDSDLTNFPLYVKLADNADVKDALSTGYDIRFTQSDGETLLKYERESWSGGGGDNVTADFWTKVPSLASTGDATEIYMYWGKTGDSDGQDAANVWTACAAVYHMNDASGNVTDSKGTYHLNGYSGTPDYGQTGKVGKCMYFLASSSERVWRDTTLGITAAPFSWECWCKSGSAAAAQCILFHGNKDSNTDFWALYLHGDVAGDPMSHLARDTDFASAVTSNGYSANVWHHLAGREIASNSRVAYLDMNVASKGTDSTERTPDNNNRFCAGGVGYTAATSYATAYIDEIRVYSCDIGESWLKFSYRNIFESDNELTWGSVESAPAAVKWWTLAGRSRFIGGGIS